MKCRTRKVWRKDKKKETSYRTLLQTKGTYYELKIPKRIKGKEETRVDARSACKTNVDFARTSIQSAGIYVKNVNLQRRNQSH